MKLKSIYNVLLGSLLTIALIGCSPIEDDTKYENDFTPDNINIECIQSTEGGNGITLKMTTPGVAGYWDYGIGTKFSDEVSFIYPIPGEATFTFHATTPYSENDKSTVYTFAEKSITCTIVNLDQELPAWYYCLVGTELEGKTWVFDGTSGDDGLWWYMSPGNDPSTYGTAWWNAGGTGVAPVDVDGKMVFDLDGGANFTYYASKTSEAITGSTWKFSSDGSILTIDGDAKILGNEEPRGSQSGEYTIISLTDDKMILYVNTNSGGTGWTWVFKPYTE